VNRIALIGLSAVLLATAAYAVSHALSNASAPGSPVQAPVAVAAGGGFPVRGRPAPPFTLVDQFGRSVSLRSLRGEEVVLAFIDSRCTTICPLTAAILRIAMHKLPGASGRVALVAVNANPVATRVADVYRFSAEHQMLHTWLYLTGSPATLKAIYRAYQVYVCVTRSGQVIHDAALFVVDGSGRERLYYDMMDAGGLFTLESETTALVAGMRAWLPGTPPRALDSYDRAARV